MVIMSKKISIQSGSIIQKRGRRLCVAVIGLLVLMMSIVSAQAATIDCTPITSLPYSITTQGVYCLTGHLAANLAIGNAITVNVNNILLD